ncbi:nucleotidyltransferase family protein [Streptococcus catagoni]|uniref:nucleotidyltransferase family protein n=1 Tax=Streptococcus catagoni TaxID=2654874 RepID=UPI00140A9C56|nr:nucleotidyltransferase family protein [Streptococcus catagoni]
MSKVYELISSNSEMMALLKVIKGLNLKDSWLCAGTLRNYVWNYQSGVHKTLSTDVDLIFYDELISYEETLEIETRVKVLYPQYDWEIKNEYYMNIHSPHTEVYKSSRDAISKFPEKCTAIGARLDENDRLEIYLPYGEKDILEFIVSPTPHFRKDSLRRALYRERIMKKNWKAIWPNLLVELVE